jgi:SAM-dependent methyltransferase
MSQRQAFDPLASTYDNTFTDSPIGRYLRAQVHAHLDHDFHPGDHVLELGCGTGEDALYLANRGIRVTATDVSESMLTITRSKTAANPLIQVHQLDLRNLPSGNWRLATGDFFTGIFSDFGPLNCLDDWRPLAEWLSKQVKPGGIVAFGVMSPLCIWETLWHGLHGDFKTATRRWRKTTTFQPDSSTEPITVRYPTIRRLTHDFAPYFRRVHVQPVGLFLPPSDVFPVIEKRSNLMHKLMSLESRFTKYGKLSLFADHYWIEFVRI